MTGKKIGYVRVSTIEQNPARQLENIEIDKKFIEYSSAKSTDRPQLKNMMEFIREEDIVYIHSMDRLARNLGDLKLLVNEMVRKKVELRFVKENIIFNGQDSPFSNLMLHLMGAFAEFERAFILERQREGIAIAKKLGKYKGRKKKMDAYKMEILKQELKTRKSKLQIARELKVGHCTLYKAIHELERQKKAQEEAQA